MNDVALTSPSLEAAESMSSQCPRASRVVAGKRESKVQTISETLGYLFLAPIIFVMTVVVGLALSW